MTKTGSGATTEDYFYDVDDEVVYETRVVGATTTYVRRFEGWEKRGTTLLGGTVTESVLPMASLQGGQLVVRLLEPDGHAIRTRNASTGAETQEVLGAFGLRLSKYQTSADSWVIPDHSSGRPGRAKHIETGRGGC